MLAWGQNSMLIFDEEIYAKKLLKSGFAVFMSGKDLYILAKYFKHIGKNKTQIEKDLFLFCEKYNPDFNRIIYDSYIKNIVKSAVKAKLTLEKEVKITKNELKSIKSVKNHNKEKILFVMLVLAKHEAKDEAKKFFANPFFTEVLRLAKVNINKEGWHKLVYELNQTGLIQATKTQTCEITFVDVAGEAEITVDNMKNIISFFPFFCVSCGKTLKNKPKRRDLCDKCYSELRKKDRHITRMPPDN